MLAVAISSKSVGKLFSVVFSKYFVLLVKIGNDDDDVTNLVDVSFRVTTIDLSFSSSFRESVKIFRVDVDVGEDVVVALSVVDLPNFVIICGFLTLFNW